ncbi:phosphatidic acid phosphatase domain-containing protein, PAP2 family [Gottschalkia acidurici 9a]|uniref:Phosphatidic acid phosphatase domain-containing protein, PAP2 family n=1 Tax=Gottschalkia acidurici (strain ATCC 7906 / DSM 604 / BCRC 14475 / CIP 104303 / KCTC 5404 / NCIMB 10678 / 9a) TaxID=1128398 RepID=K0AZK3_GOTA9|nr:phosphatase PAP2 family protein [Gottschalkia acidurici]AFS79228.1 phosphatidic acid phosphatase domain-containing protein, PAP2 family [Gottschalkia acidurici 9a]
MKNKHKITREIPKKSLVKYLLGLFIAVLFFIVFMNFSTKVRGISEGIYFDKLILSRIHNHINQDIKNIMIFISFLGSAKFYLPLCSFLTIYLLRKKHYIESIGLINGVLGSAIVNFVLKRYYVRVRPEMYFQVQETGYSFPSGHSMVAISFYFICTYLLVRNRPWDIKKIIIWMSTIVFVTLIGFSRIYLGVHWPTDVIGGLSLGFVWLYFNIVLVELLHKKYKKPIR